MDTPAAVDQAPVSPKFPVSYQIAQANRFTSVQVDELLTGSARPSFVYGSLMFPSIMGCVIHQRNLEKMALSMTPAGFSGFKRHSVSEADFPAILPSKNPDDTIQGFVASGLDDTYSIREPRSLRKRTIRSPSGDRVYRASRGRSPRDSSRSVCLEWIRDRHGRD
jgi:hypothetical protein